MTALPVKRTDGKGRITLGKEHANSEFIVYRGKNGRIQLIPAVTVPADEAWLHRNRAALASVMRGLEQTGKGEFAEGPDLDEDSELADSCGD